MKKLWSEGVYDSEEYRKSLSEGMKKARANPDSVFNSEEYRQKISQITKKLFTDEKFLLAYQNGMHQSPNSKEIYLDNILDELFNNEYEFVGNHSLWIGGKNPDFINKKNKKLIELFGNYWHSEKIVGVDTKTHELDRINHFNDYGYDTLIIWENELDDLTKVKKKLLVFNNVININEEN